MFSIVHTLVMIRKIFHASMNLIELREKEGVCGSETEEKMWHAWLHDSTGCWVHYACLCYLCNFLFICEQTNKTNERTNLWLIKTYIASHIFWEGKQNIYYMPLFFPSDLNRPMPPSWVICEFTLKKEQSFAHIVSRFFCIFLSLFWKKNCWLRESFH